MNSPTQEAVRLFKRYEYLKQQRVIFDNHWDDLLKFMNPHSPLTQSVTLPGARRSVGEIFSSVALNAVSTAVAGIAGILVPSTSKWFDIEFSQRDINDLPGVAQWLEECSVIAFEELVNSNLSTAIGQIIRDLLIVGTACVFATERKGYDGVFEGLNFLTYEAGSYVLAENHEREVDTLFQKLKMTLRAAALQWGKEALSEQSRERLENYPDEMLDILHCQFPREDVDPRKVDDSTPANKLPFASIYYEVNTKHKLAEGGFHERAYLAPRWEVWTGETYGRSPAMLALPDVKTLNKQRELHLKALAKQIDPPLAILNRRVIGKLSTDPGARNYVEDPNAILPLTVTGDLRGTAIDEQLLEQSIRQIFFNHLLQFPTQNQNGGSTPVSATEFSLRSEQAIRNAIPSIAVIQTDLLKPLVERVFGILQRAGRFPDLPPSLIEYFGVDPRKKSNKNPTGRIQVKYTNPISRSQKTQEADSFVRFLSIATQLSQVIPGILDVLNQQEVGLYLVDKFSVSKTLVRTREEIQAQNEQKQAQAQVAAAQQGIANFADSANKISPFIETLQNHPEFQQGGTPR